MAQEKNEVTPEVTPEDTPTPKKTGIIKRYKTKIAKLEEELIELKKGKQDKPEKVEDQKGFGYAEKAYMKVNDVNPDEYDMVQDVMNDSGKSLEEVLNSPYFRSVQKDFRDNKASQEAMPSKKGKPTTSSKDTVEYWLAKGELPPADQVQLRRDVVNAKIKREKQGSKFTDNPIGNVRIK